MVANVTLAAAALAMLAMTVTGCGGPPARAARHLAALPAAHVSSDSPALAADAAICKTFAANIGDGGTAVITHALLTARTSISYPLRHDIAKALTATGLKADENDQAMVMLRCAEVQAGVTPGR